MQQRACWRAAHNLTILSSADPYGSMDPGTFNVLGSPYSDKFCTDRTGGDHVVSAHAFGIGSGGCSLSPLVRGPRYALTQCRDDGSVYAQVRLFSAALR